MMRKSNSFKLFCLLTLFLGFHIALSAQVKENYFTPIDLQTLNLSDSQKTRLENLENQKANKSIQFVEIGKLQDFIHNSELTFNIPGTEEEYVALVKEFAFESEYDYVWN